MSKGGPSLSARIGLISDEMTAPRNLTGVIRLTVSVMAVAFSCFFVYVGLFGPPVSEIFKGTFLLGVTVLSILMYRGRKQPIRQGFVWLDEFFSVIDITALCGALAMWLYWLLFNRVELWSPFSTPTTWLIAGFGAAAGLGIYCYEALRPQVSEKPTLSDYLFIVGSIATIQWWIYTAVDLTNRIGGPVDAPVIFFGTILVVTNLEIARRIVGPVIPLIGFLFFIYSFDFIAQAMPGLLNHLGYPLDRVMEFLMLSPDGITGLIIGVFASYIVIFVILGAFLEKTGLGSLIIDTTYRITGQRTGGPGLAAVVSSGFFGMISGSGVANVVTTGTFTIPLMRRVGYRPEFAGAVEAAASTGGAYMPPIMGAGAFLLAELTETSYFEVIKIALIPALLYYLSIGLAVYFRASKRGLHGVPVSELPPWSRIIPRLHLLLPIPVMVFLLMAGDSPFLAAGRTILLIVLLRAIDLLASVRTPWSTFSWKICLGVSLAMGVFAHFFGMKIGAPFVWFVTGYYGLTVSDALFWVAATFIALKAIEIGLAGSAAEFDSSAITDPPRAEGDLGERHAGALRCLGSLSTELVKNIWVSLESGAKNTLLVGCIAGVLGILLSAATQSDLPGRASAMLVKLSFGLLPVTIFWVIVAGYVVGMGLPIVASYVILAIFAVGALTHLGVSAVNAHMISYWIAVVSAVTPPVALAAYAASAIAKSDPVKTANEAVRLASLIFIMPVLFVYTPLLLNGSTMDVVVTVIAVTLGVIAWALFLEGYRGESIFRSVERLLIGFATLFLLMPVDHFVEYMVGIEQRFAYFDYAIGVVLMAAVLAIRLSKKAKSTTRVA
jgi:TRAP transporter 4TM/12TM fusion protein